MVNRTAHGGTQAMYGSIMRARIKQGKRDEYIRLLQDLVPTAEDYGHGLHSVELGWEEADPQRAVVVIHFRDKESYLANGQRPETDAQFRRQAELFDGEPEWIDLDYVEYVGNPLTSTAGAGS
jgi:quinol monooxygenase YgiN